MAKIRGGQVRSIQALKKSVKKSSGGGMITRIPKDAPLTIRILQEPDRWFEYFEHFDTSTNKGYICIDGECPGCADDVRQTKRFLVNAVDVDKSTVVAVQLPTSLVTILLKRYDRNGTLLDRNWELSRSGAGLDTEYDAESDGKSKFNFDLYEPLDLGEVLQGQIANDGGEDEDDDDTPPWEKDEPTKGKPPRTMKLSRSKRKPEPEDEDDEDDEPLDTTSSRSIGRAIKRSTRTLSRSSREGAPDDDAAGMRQSPRKLIQPVKRSLPKAGGKTLGGGTKKLGR